MCVCVCVLLLSHLFYLQDTFLFFQMNQAGLHKDFCFQVLLYAGKILPKMMAEHLHSKNLLFT